MNVVYKSIGYLRQWYSQVNPATLTGAIDILVVEQPDGTLVASPFHVRFGKLGVLRAKEKLVNIAINDEKIGDLHMKLGDQGEAFFLEECDDEDGVPVGLITSPLPSRPSTPTEEAVADDDFDKDLYGAMLSMEEGGKRKRRRKRKRRSIISASNTSLLDDSKTGGASSSSEVEDEEKAPLPSVVDNQDGCGKSVVERTMSVESTDTYELAECSIPAVRISKVSNGATESDSSIRFSDDWNSEGEGTAFSSMRCVLSDSELPMLSSKAIPFKSSPFSDSEAVENRNQSDVMWGWGQLPGRNKQDHESSSDDGGNFAGNDDGEKALATALDETHFRAIEPVEEDTVRVEDETASVTKKTRTISSTSHGSSSRNRRDTEGLYLDDVLSLEPSEANVYLQKTSRTPYNSVSDSTFASTAGGQADSSTQAAVAERPPSTAVERAASPAGGSDIDSGTDCQTTEDASDGMSEQQDNIEITISLCGFISGSNNVDKDKFEEKQVDYDAFLQNPLTIVNDPNLVICMGGSRYLNWQAAAPVIVSLAVFKQPLSQESMECVIQSAQPQPQTNRLMGWLWRRPSRIDQQTTVDGSSAPPSPVKTGQPDETRHQRSIGTSYSAASSSENEVANILHEELQRTQSARELLPSKREQYTTGAKPSSSTHSNGRPMRKSTRLGSEQLKTLCLQSGANTITFSVTTQYQGTTRCVANVFLWKWSDKLVVSDIDGTITKSDVMGQILPVVGKDWTQGGVAQLYQNINNNGYKFIYVSSRAIGQASMTKGYLNWINQHGVSLPAGPLLLSPTSLMIAFRREVIEKKPEKFKIECLKDIKALFPGNPFVAGFGNKSNDVLAYSAVGVPSNRMFTINPRGELKHEKLPTYTTSYTGLGELVDSFFPMLDKEQDFVRAHDYSDFTYWRQDLEAFSDQVDQFQLA